ncbi:MAG: acriflavin resistance protein [Xanthobacteraceae bacterium]
MTSFLKMVADTTGLFADDSSDGVIGVLMSGLAGVATALAVAIVLTVYFRSRYRSVRDVLRHGLAAAAVFALIAFVAYDMRHAALAYLGINPTKPAVEFEIRLPKTAASAISGNTQVELHTDRNQTLAQLQGQAQGAPASDGDGLTVLRGSVPLDYRTSDRVVILNLPGLASCEFRLRLAASPSPSDQFGPWHLADRVASPVTGEETRSQQRDAFAIRYRVL